jgi:signal transduction histidine kinase
MAGSARLSSRFGWRAFWLTLIILVATTISTGLYWRGRILDTTSEALDAHISTVETALGIDIAGGFDPFADGRVFLLVTPEIGLQIFSDAGEPLAVSQDLNEAPLIAIDNVPPGGFTEEQTDVKGYGNALVRAAAFETTQKTYFIETVASLSDVDTACVAMCLIAPIASIGIAALVALAVALSVGAAMAPVRKMSERAATLSNRERPEPLNVPADTAELRELSSRLDQLLEQIRVAFDREQQFLDDASHELRTPIAIARAELDLALRAAHDSDTAAALESSLEELRRLDGMASDLLMLARERAAGTESYVPVDLGDVAKAAVATVRKDPGQRPVTIDVHGAGRIVGDPDSLERALVNLISNSVRHCKGLVRVAISDAGGAIEVTVADDGPGIPEHLLETLFDRFTRGRSRGARSTGLGTAIAAEVVRHHGGTIRAENRPEGGAIVTMRFPRGSQFAGAVEGRANP